MVAMGEKEERSQARREEERRRGGRKGDWEERGEANGRYRADLQLFLFGVHSGCSIPEWDKVKYLSFHSKMHS